MPDRFDVTRLPEHQDRRRLLAGIGGVFALVFFFVASRLFRRGSQLRYELTIEVETEVGLRRGSSIIEARIRREIPFWGAPGVSYHLRGEAPAVTLPDGRMLFALLRDGINVSLPELAAAETGAMRPLSDRMLSGTNGTGKFWPQLKAARPVLVVDAATMSGRNAQNYPALVVIDPADFESVEMIDPRAPEGALRSGERLVGLRIAIVDAAPVFTLEKRAPWVLSISSSPIRIATASAPSRYDLRPSRFVARN
jgi:hypothetical protein